MKKGIEDEDDVNSNVIFLIKLTEMIKMCNRDKLKIPKLNKF